MQIKIEAPVTSVRADSLAAGDLFEYCGKTYIVASKNGVEPKFNHLMHVINLKNFTVYTHSKTELVKPVGKLVVSL